MLKIDVLTAILEQGLVGVIRADDEEQAIRTANALVEGGIRVIEMTFTVPGAARAIAALRARDGQGELRVGAGTVLDGETARIAILEGAQFLVGPAVDPATARLANRYGVPYIPGAGTLTEIVRAMELGADIVKVFPAVTLGPGFLESVRGPLPQASLMPTGGIALGDVGRWMGAGAVALGTGSQLTSGAREGNYAAVAAMASRFVDAVRSARG